MSSRRKFYYYSLVLLLPICLTWLFSEACLRSEAEGLLCLSWLDSSVQRLKYVIIRLGDYPKFWYNAVFPWCCGFVVVMALLSLARGKARPALFWLLTTLPILGEWYSLLGQANYAILFYVSGVVLLAIFWLFSRKIDDYEDSVAPLKYTELALFMCLIFALACMRFFALNRIPASWDAELCIYRLYSGSFNRLWQHEAGWSPQSSTGLSWFIMNRLLGHFDEPSIYHLYHRLLGCLISIVKVSVLFLFLRAVCGRFAAFFGASILAFGPPEDWWARVPNYHHWPGLVTVLVIWATLNAMEKKTWKSFILLSALSASTRWVYPSAMFMVGVPITFFGSLLIFEWSKWKPHLAKIAVLLVGIAVWCEWLSLCRALYMGRWEWLPPVMIPSHSAMEGSLFAKLHHIFIENGADFFTEVFFKQLSPSHWTTALTPQPWKVMPSVVGVLALLSLARFLGERRDRITWLIMIALFFGALPGITSSMAERRIGAVFILFIILAAREAAWLSRFMERSAGRYIVSTLRVATPIVIGAYLAALSGAYFFFTTRGIPRQQAIGKVFQDNVRDNYLLVDLTGQLGCDLFHAVHRQIKASDCKVSIVSSKYAGEFSAAQLIANPHFDKNEWWYSEKGVTDLGVCTDWPTRKWEGVTFLITETKEAGEWVEMLKQRFPNGKLEEVKVSYIPYHEEKVIVFTTPL